MAQFEHNHEMIQEQNNLASLADVSADMLSQELEGGDKLEKDTKKFKSYGFFTDRQAEDYAILINKKKLKDYESEYLTALRQHEQAANLEITSLLLVQASSNGVIQEAFANDVVNNPDQYKVYKILTKDTGASLGDKNREEVMNYVTIAYGKEAVRDLIPVKVNNERYRLPSSIKTYKTLCEKNEEERTIYEESIVASGREFAESLKNVLIKPLKLIKE